MLKDKTALITGASRGIGRAIARKFVAEGASIVINYARSREKAEKLLNEIRDEYGDGRAICFRADVSSFHEVQKMIEETVNYFGSLDILVNNAGIIRDNLILRMKETEWEQVVDTNLKGTFNCIKAAARVMMKQRSGSIINISSVVSFTGNPGQANYVSSKAGINGLTKTAARELATRGIRVNAIAPGFIETEMTSDLPEKVKKELFARIPLQRFGRGEDVANLAAYLASEAANYITGQIIRVDGGMVM